MNKKKGFTLIELMIVIVIVGILAAVGVPIYRGYVRRAMAAEGRALVGSIASAQRVYYAERSTYLAGTVDGTSGTSTTLQIDPRGNRYFTSATCTVGAGPTLTITTTGTGDAAGITVTGTMSPTTSLTITETGI